MIYYFSATGNSRHVATRIAEALGTQGMRRLHGQHPGASSRTLPLAGKTHQAVASLAHYLLYI